MMRQLGSELAQVQTQFLTFTLNSLAFGHPDGSNTLLPHQVIGVVCLILPRLLLCHLLVLFRFWPLPVGVLQ